MKAICQLCGEVFAITSLELLRFPLAGYMFSSPDPEHRVPDPFDRSLTWEHMRCPYGHIHRPMVTPDLILTDKGMVRLPKDGSPAFLDLTAKAEVDRESIGDRVMQVSDEEAEKAVRDAMATGTGILKDGKHISVEEMMAESAAKTNEAVVEITKDTMAERYGAHVCPTCGKACESEKKLQGHIGGAHRAKKRGK